MRKLMCLPIALTLAGIMYAGCLEPVEAQNIQCTTRPVGDSTNACASTAFVQQNVGLPGTFIVTAYGADNTCGTDSTTAINNAIAAAKAYVTSPAYGTLDTATQVYFPPGIYCVSSINATRTAGLNLVANPATVILYGNQQVSTSKPIIDATGSSSMSIKGLIVSGQNPAGTDPTIIPSVGILLAETSATGDSNNNYLENIGTLGKFTAAAVYIYGSVDNSFYSGGMQQSQLDRPALFIGSTNVYSVSSPYVTINTGTVVSGNHTFFKTQIHHLGGASTTAYTIQLSGIYSISFFGALIDNSGIGQVQFSGANFSTSFYSTQFYSELGSAPTNAFTTDGGATIDYLTVIAGEFRHNGFSTNFLNGAGFTNVTLAANEGGQNQWNVNSNNANALAVGPNGTTNPSLKVDASTASAATGVEVVATAAATAPNLRVISSGTNEGLRVNAKGTGSILLQTVATGNVGVKAASPSNDLTVLQSADTQTAGGLALYRSDGTSRSVIFQGNDNNIYIFNVGSGGVELYANNGTQVLSANATRVLSAKDVVVTSTGTSALSVAQTGATTAALQIDTNTASSGTGVKITSAASGGRVALAAISDGTNEGLNIDAKGTGTIILGATSTGAITLTRATTLSAALTYGGVTLSNSVTGTGSMVLSTSPSFTTDIRPASDHAVDLGTTSLAWNNLYIHAIISDGTAAHSWMMGRATSGVGNSLTVQSGGAQSGGTDLTGGNAIISAGIGTGTAGTLGGAGHVAIYAPNQGSATGTTDRSPLEAVRIYRDSAAYGYLCFRGSSCTGTNYAILGSAGDTTTYFNGEAGLQMRVANNPIGSYSGTTLTISPTTAATSTTTGSLVNGGGFGNAGAGWFGTYVATGVVAVASLPSCGAGIKGARMFVNNATATTFASTVDGGGANNVPVVCDGTNWIIGANDNDALSKNRNVA